MGEHHIISIIIPVHNAKKTLGRTVKSVCDQTIRHLRREVMLELILVDDGSTDESGALCDAYLDWNTATDQVPQKGALRVKVIHMEDEGVSEARNRGLEAADGDLITFLDADDALDLSMLERLLSLHEETGAEICGCGFAAVSPKAQDFARRQESDHAAGKAPQILTGTVIVRDGILSGDTRVWSKLFTRSLIGKKRFRKGLSIGEDMLFVTSLIAADTRYAVIEDPLYLYTINPMGAMERPFTPSYMDQLRCYEEAEKVIAGNLPELLQDPVVIQRLRRLQIISDVLTATKLARLPNKQLKVYGNEFYQCRMKLKKHQSEPGIASVLPKDYRLKSFMLMYLPTAFKALVRVTSQLKKT